MFTCIGALSLAGALHLVDQDLFCWWLCERQTKSGGLNGRPEKLQDVSVSSITTLSFAAMMVASVPKMNFSAMIASDDLVA